MQQSLTKDFILSILPKRAQKSHKGTYGKALTIAGSIEMTGAAYLSSFATLKVGAGYSLLACPEKLMNTISILAPEVVLINAGKKDYINTDSIYKIQEQLKSANVILIGPGLGQHQDTFTFIQKLIKTTENSTQTFIIDADALNCISKLSAVQLPTNTILTPHPKELSRLLKVDIKEIQSNRTKYAQIAAQSFKSIVILKGHNTIIATPDGEIYINPTGNSALATAGTGDVHAGMIAGFAAQGASLIESALIGTYLHGLAGEEASKKQNEYSVTARDVLNAIPNAINRVLLS